MDCGWNSGAEEADLLVLGHITLNFLHFIEEHCVQKKQGLLFSVFQIAYIWRQSNQLLLSALTTLKKELFLKLPKRESNFGGKNDKPFQDVVGNFTKI